MDRIHTDGGTLVLSEPNDGVVADNVEALRHNATALPAVAMVFVKAEVHWLADFFHRLETGRRLGHKHVWAAVREGNRRDAVLFAASANATHCLPWTNADKRRAVLLLLRDLVG